MPKRSRSLIAFVAACLSSACAGESQESDGAHGVPTFHELNGVMWFYTTANDLKYRDLAAELGDWKARGIRTIGIYSPYDGDKEQWLGAAPRSFYDVPPQNGTLDDFRVLVDTAHDNGMKVVAFMGFHSIDERSELFVTAEKRYASGDRDSPEVAAFHWTVDPTFPTPTPAPMGPSAWKWSDVAGAYYWALWDNAGLDVNLPGAAVQIERAIEFWMDVGLDGLMLDSGVVHADFRALWVDLPKSKKSDLWLTFESTWAEEADHFDEFGLTSWFAFEDNDYANTYSLVVHPEAGETAIGADELEAELLGVDRARERGKLVHAWSILEREYPDPRMRVQEAALLAGAGIVYGAPMHAESYVNWPVEVRAQWERVLARVNDNPALHPAASRRRVATGPDPLAYAMIRTAKDGSQVALLAYNFSSEARTITLDLTGAGVALHQTPDDLWSETSPAPIQGPSYAIALDGYGFALLELAESA